MGFMAKWEITSLVRSAERNFAKGSDCASHGLITDTYDPESFARYCQRFNHYLPEGWVIGHGGYQSVIDRVLSTKPRTRNAYIMVIYDPTRMRSPAHN